MEYNDINIGNLDSICMSCEKAKLGTLIDSLYKTLTEGGKYDGDTLTEDTITMLNNMCPVASNLQLGTIINNILEASKKSEAAESLTEDEASEINGTCPGFSKCQLGTILSECIEKINGAISDSNENEGENVDEHMNPNQDEEDAIDTNLLGETEDTAPKAGE